MGELYRIYLLSNNKPPAGLPDLAPLQPAGPAGFAALKKGEVIVRYGAMMSDTNQGSAASSSDEVLAYEKQTPESGGEVLMLDRTVRKMTADEFKAVQKAGKDS